MMYNKSYRRQVSIARWLYRVYTHREQQYLHQATQQETSLLLLILVSAPLQKHMTKISLRKVASARKYKTYNIHQNNKSIRNRALRDHLNLEMKV